VTNMTKEYSRFVFDIGVAYREDVDEVIEVIKAVDEDLRQEPDYREDILEPIEVLGLDQFADSAVIIKARGDHQADQAMAGRPGIQPAAEKAFNERNIEIPFPHVMLYMGEDKKEGSRPLRVLMQNRQKTPSSE